MGWRPWEVRAAVLPDFDDAVDGFQMSRGHDPGPDLSDEAIAEMEEALELYARRSR